MKTEVLYDNLKTGDVVFTTGRGLFSRTIKNVTDSDVTHVGFVVNLYGFKFIFEMLAGGITVSTFKRYMKSKRRSIVKVGRPAGLSGIKCQQLRKLILQDFLDEIDYDWGGVIKFIFKHTAQNKRDSLYCSEHVFTRLNSILQRYPEKQAVQISPADLARGKYFDFSDVKWELTND